MKRTTLAVTMATGCRILSLRKDRSIVRTATKFIPGIGVSMGVNTSKVNLCPGGCRYCFCALGIRQESPEPILKSVGYKSMNLVIKAVNAVNPAAITTAEAVELGFCPSAIQELRDLRAGMNPNIRMIFTTKFPSVYQKLDMPNTAMVVTLSNPRNVPGLEPHIPSLNERLLGVVRAAAGAVHLKVGVRLLIMQEEDIQPLYKAFESIKAYVDPNLVWIDFLRSPFVARAGKFEDALNGYIDLTQYFSYPKYGKSLRENIIQKTISTFSGSGVTYDRLPLCIRKHYKTQGIRVIDTHDRDKCYIRADEVECVRGACNWCNRICLGVPFTMRVKKSEQVDGMCRNITGMTAEQHQSTLDMWEWIVRVKAFAYGSESKSEPTKWCKSVLELLRSAKLTKHTGLRR